MLLGRRRFLLRLRLASGSGSGSGSRLELRLQLGRRLGPDHGEHSRRLGIDLLRDGLDIK